MITLVTVASDESSSSSSHTCAGLGSVYDDNDDDDVNETFSPPLVDQEESKDFFIMSNSDLKSKDRLHHSNVIVYNTNNINIQHE
jgi:hypothetical protein